MLEKNKFKVLLIGPRTNLKKPNDTGGAVVLFENLIEQLIIKGIDFNLIDTNKKNYRNVIVAYSSIFIQVIIKQRKCNSISLHSSRDFIFISLLLMFLKKIFNKQISLRKFGGELQDSYSNCNSVKQRYLNCILSNYDVIFLEIKSLTKFFSKINTNTHWFPNVRDRKLTPTLPRKYNKKIVFISHVKKEKGITEIIEASKSLDESYSIDIYGPIVNKDYSEESFYPECINYCGALPSEKVLKTLNEYDVLILPTYYEGEGYPGIIIEAYSLGIPVISTHWGGISEIVVDKSTGFLVNIKNTNELLCAIKNFNSHNYSYMSLNAYKKFDEFQSDSQTSNFINLLKASI